MHKMALTSAPPPSSIAAFYSGLCALFEGGQGGDLGLVITPDFWVLLTKYCGSDPRFNAVMSHVKLQNKQVVEKYSMSIQAETFLI